MGINRQENMRPWVWASALLLVVAATSSETALPSSDATFSVQSTDAFVQLDETAAGAMYWRVRALVKVPLEGWVMSKIQWFESQDGSGDAVTGEAIASSFRGSGDVPPNTEFAIPNAMDGSYDTVWESEDGEPGQWYGIKFAEKKDIKSMVIRIPDMVKGPASVMVEKSEDGELWGRVVDISDMKMWGVEDQLYKFVPMDQLPPSVFSIRSQLDTAYCVGVRTRLQNPEDEDSPIVDIEVGAKLELQKCLDDTITQWWSFDVNRGILHNAYDKVYIADVSENLAVDTEIGIAKCTNGCPEMGNNAFVYSDSVRGGFLRSRVIQNLVFSPQNASLAQGMPVVLGTCGDNADTPADLNVCPDNKQGQWELLPMFALEMNKQSITCAPYSHTLADPTPATSRQEAQRLCAADNKCSAYNWADGTAEDFANEVFLCHKLHDVHPGVVGWELGIRAGRGYDSPYKKRAAVLSMEL